MPRNYMRCLLPARFEIRERILFGLAVALAVVAFYFIYTAPPRAAPGRWIEWQFLGTVLFITVAGRDRAYFTGLYCTLLSGTHAIGFAFFLTFRHEWSHWATEVAGLFLVAFGLFMSIAIPVAFAWCVTRLVACLERRFYK
jgi:hypothetical protein